MVVGVSSLSFEHDTNTDIKITENKSLISFIFYGIMAVCVLSLIWLPLGSGVAAVISLPIRYVLSVSNLLARFPLSALVFSRIRLMEVNAVSVAEKYADITTQSRIIVKNIIFEFFLLKRNKFLSDV